MHLRLSNFLSATVLESRSILNGVMRREKRALVLSVWLDDPFHCFESADIRAPDVIDGWFKDGVVIVIVDEAYVVSADSAAQKQI